MAKVKKSGLAAKLGAEGRKAFEAHKDDETTFDSGGRLPAGIENGIAQLRECKFDVYKKGPNAGEWYWLASGTVKEPKTHNGIPIEGTYTQIMEPLCATPKRSRKTVEEHFEWILNEMRKLGLDTSEIGFDDLEAAAAALKDAAPYFRFRTWKGTPSVEFPEAQTNEVWAKAVEYIEEEDADDVEEDEEEEEEEEEADEDAADEDEAEEEDAEEEEDEEAEEDDESWNLENLAATADKWEKRGKKGPGADAAKEVAKRAKACGLDPKDYKTWAACAAAIEGDDVEEDEEEEEEEDAEAEDVPPTKEDIFMYKAPKARKAVECEVIAVFAKKQTCNLKSLDDGKIFKAVAWSDLQNVE